MKAEAAQPHPSSPTTSTSGPIQPLKAPSEHQALPHRQAAPAVTYTSNDLADTDLEERTRQMAMVATDFLLLCVHADNTYRIKTSDKETAFTNQKNLPNDPKVMVLELAFQSRQRV